MRWSILLVWLAGCPDETVVDVHVTSAGSDVPGATVALTAVDNGAIEVTDDAGLAHLVLSYQTIDAATELLTVVKPGFVVVQQMPTADMPIEIALVAP